MSTLALKPGTLVVLEGLDKTGKSTQCEALRRCLDPTSTVQVHMPTGMTAFTRGIYSMLESDLRSPTSEVARQLAHLACHAESVPRILDLLRTQAVILDRWWWSTFAYGWDGGDLAAAGITPDGFKNLVDSIWSPVSASVIFLFDEPYAGDVNNSDLVRAGYRRLAHEYNTLTVRVSRGEPNQITDMLLAEMRSRSLVIGDPRET